MAQIQRLHISKHKPHPALVIAPVGYDTIVTPTEEGERVLGGAGSYASLAASYFTNTQLVSLVGEDFIEEYIDYFRARHIDISGLLKVPGKSFYWKGRYFEDFNKRETLQLDLNVLENFTPCLSKKFSKSSYVFIGSIDPDLQLKALAALENPLYTIVDVIDHWIKAKRNAFLEVLNKVDLLVINDNESRVLAQEANIVAAGNKLKAMGAKSVVIKKAEHGALLFHSDGLFALPSYPLEKLKDPTGAGDAFAGALIGYLAGVGKTDFFNLKHAVAYAVAIASITIEGLSCANLKGTSCLEIQKRYERLIEMVRF